MCPGVSEEDREGRSKGLGERQPEDPQQIRWGLGVLSYRREGLCRLRRIFLVLPPHIAVLRSWELLMNRAKPQPRPLCFGSGLWNLRIRGPETELKHLSAVVLHASFWSISGAQQGNKSAKLGVRLEPKAGLFPNSSSVSLMVKESRIGFISFMSRNKILYVIEMRSEN